MQVPATGETAGCQRYTRRDVRPLQIQIQESEMTGPSMIIDRLRLVRTGDHIAIYEGEELIHSAPDWTAALAFVDDYNFKPQRDALMKDARQ
jgi:hypothetical protein